MKVLYVLAKFPSTTTTFVTNEMNGLRRHGAEVEVAALWPSARDDVVHEQDRFLLARTIKLHRGANVLAGLFLCPYFWLVRPLAMARSMGLVWEHFTSALGLLKFLACLPAALALAWHCGSRRCDILHAHFLSSAALVAMITSWLTGIPFTITAHAYDIFVHDPRTFPQAVARKCREAAFVIVVHRFGRNFLLSRFPGIPAEKLRVLHIGIDPAVFEPRPRSRRPDEAIHILSNGSLIEKKGHDVLVEAVARLREAGHQVMLTIIGGGGAAALRRQIACLGLEQVVVLASKVPQSQVVNMLAESDLFALASKRAANGDMDGIPTVLLEALAMEVPVVTTRLSGIPELVIEGQTGYLAEPGDAASFATALQEALAQPERAASMARRGRERVIAEFSASTNAARLLEMWKCHLHGIRLFTE